MEELQARWSSGLVALTCEAELITICERIQSLLWIHILLDNLGISTTKNGSLTLGSDSKAAFDWIKKDRVTNRTRRMNRKYHFVKREVTENKINLQHIPSEELVANILTKSQSKQKIFKHCT